MSLVLDLQRFPIVARSFANIALNVNIREKVHGNDVRSLSPAGFAATPFDVKGKASRLVSPRFGFEGFGKHLANAVEHPGIGGEIGTGGASDGRLVDNNHLIHHIFDFFHFRPFHLQRPQLFGKRDAPGEVMLEGRVEEFVDQAGFSRTGHAGNAN